MSLYTRDNEQDPEMLPLYYSSMTDQVCQIVKALGAL